MTRVGGRATINFGSWSLAIAVRLFLPLRDYPGRFSDRKASRALPGRACRFQSRACKQRMDRVRMASRACMGRRGGAGRGCDDRTPRWNERIPSVREVTHRVSDAFYDAFEPH